MSVGLDESGGMENARAATTEHPGQRPPHPLPVQDALSASAKTINDIEALSASAGNASAIGGASDRATQENDELLRTPSGQAVGSEGAADGNSVRCASRAASSASGASGAASGVRRRGGGSGRASGDDATPSRYLPQVLNNDPEAFDEVRKGLEQIVVAKMAEAAGESRYAGGDSSFVGDRGDDGGADSGGGASEDDEGRQLGLLRPLDALGNAIVSAQAIAAYASTLDIVTLRKLTAHIVADTGFWLARAFRFYDSCVFCHDDSREGLIRVVRMLLHLKYEKFNVDGYQALYAKPPCIYISQTAEQESPSGATTIGHALCNSLGLPRALLRIIPTLSDTPNFSRMNISLLSKQIEQDMQRGFVPLLVVASAGTGQCGQRDDFARLLDLCRARGLWLHADGHALAALVLGASQSGPLRCADSITVPLGSWLGVPSLPYVTLYCPPKPALAHAAGLTLFNIHSKLHCLPLWATLRCLGQTGLRDRIAHCFKLSDLLLNTLDSLSGLVEVVGRQKKGFLSAANPDSAISASSATSLTTGGNSGIGSSAVSPLVSAGAPGDRGVVNAVDGHAPSRRRTSMVDRATAATNAGALFEAVQPVVTFRFKPSLTSSLSASSAAVLSQAVVSVVTSNGHTDVEGDSLVILNQSYLNNLNLWLGQMVNREVPQVTIELTEVDGHGICVRFNPLEGAHLQGTTACDMEHFCKTLENHVAIIAATVNQKKRFHRLLAGDHPEFGHNLRLVEIGNWAGLGGVRYLPDGWGTAEYHAQIGNALPGGDSKNLCNGDLGANHVNESSHKRPSVEMSESDRDLLNHVNRQLVTRLRSSDSAFSLGEGTDGIACVRFGMVTEDLSVEELIHMVLTAGHELEESCKQLEEMSELVRQAVEEANAAIERENEERLYQEGLLKHVPIVGSLLQWWSPPSDEGTGVKGRSFNLTSGLVETTENTYKYHMQMKSEAPAPNTPPPQEQIQIQASGVSAGAGAQRQPLPHSRTNSQVFKFSRTNSKRMRPVIVVVIVVTVS